MKALPVAMLPAEPSFGYGEFDSRGVKRFSKTSSTSESGEEKISKFLNGRKMVGLLFVPQSQSDGRSTPLKFQVRSHTPAPALSQALPFPRTVQRSLTQRP